MSLLQCCHGTYLLLVLSLFQFILNRNGITEAFETIPPDRSRRIALERISFITLTNVGVISASIQSSNASEDNNGVGSDSDLSLAQPMDPSGASRPSAPLEYLLPAARVGIYIYKLLSITEELARIQQNMSNENNNADTKAAEQEVAAIVAKLDTLILSPPSFIKTGDPYVSRGGEYEKYGIPIVGEIGVAAQKRKERRDRAIDVGFAPQFFEVGELVGERFQWYRLQNAEKTREGASEIRRAFNIYTTNLNFNPNKYQWKGSTQEKSQRIRNDRLPTTTDVIRSDLDARDLYRNQVQTSLDDAKAEYIYQIKESKDNYQKFDPTELVEILLQAQASVDKWFGFIPDGDVKAALEAVQREQM